MRLKINKILKHIKSRVFKNSHKNKIKIENKICKKNI